ncbi:hypothetical protein L208DRAFT_1386229 [Tricholoma matsutake]|nr:hypothetical protein L208DRAFT_1386229 [Tricholoma matsutake 945]
MIYFINTGLLTILCAAACLITYVTWPLGLVAAAIYYSLSKLYFNSLLGMLNARDSLRNNLDGGILEIVSDHLPAASDAHYGSKSTDGPYTEEKRVKLKSGAYEGKKQLERLV